MSTQNEDNHEIPNQPKKWWQWFLLYPVLLTSVIAAIPTYIEVFKSTKYDVPFGQSNSAKEQYDSWRRNLSCLSAPVDPLVTKYNVRVDATICQSGDVLVKIFSPDDREFYKWVEVNSVINEQRAAIGWLISNAQASTEQEQISQALEGAVICQRYLDQWRLLRRISVQGRGCFDEIINTYTGAVESTTKAPCDKNC